MKIKNPLHLVIGSNVNDGPAPDKVTTFRRLLPQFLASLAQHLISWDMGFALAFPTIVVPSVIGASFDINPDETLHMTPDEASWLASISFIVQPIGNVLSGLITDWLGRKKAILLINIVPAIGWLMLATADTAALAYTSFTLLGIGVGLTSSVCYVSETCEPSIRGILMACSGIATTVGMFMVFLLGSLMPWRHVAFTCAAIPIVNIIVGFLVPETPIWLLAKKRECQAERSLQWLRGWVSPKAVSAELNQLKRVSELSTSCMECEKQEIKCEHPPPSLLDKCKDMTRKRTLKPFVLVSILFVLMQFSGMFATRPFIVSILISFGINFDANFVTVILGAIGILANFCILFSVRLLGKRNIYLYSMLGNFITCFGLAIYGYVFFPSGWSSIETSVNDTSTKAAQIKEIVGNWNYFALAMFLLMQFFLSVGVSSVPYFLMMEIFPFKSRSFYCSIVSAENQLFAFIAAKTYYDSERLLSLPGVFCFYGILGVFGYVLMYFIMPETEHRSLEDIELHYSDNNKTIFDINIRINAVDSLPEIKETKKEKY